jgi:hypothetical protein
MWRTALIHGSGGCSSTLADKAFLNFPGPKNWGDIRLGRNLQPVRRQV